KSRVGSTRIVHHGRSHLQRGYIDRSADPKRHGSLDAGPHVVCDRASFIHHSAREPHCSNRKWQDRRTRHTRGIVENARALLSSVHATVSPSTGNTIWISKGSRYSGTGRSA